ncbi:TraR/DksA C4-type zinc finger protein [Simulacricoccus sp. 17bor-14]|nr:TraR/DksA C4-type zinc finger protein [Simulacricoccus sp. 17bor-14]
MTSQARQMLQRRRDTLRLLLLHAPAPGALPVRQEREELDEVEAALARIEAGRFGTCEHCGGAVGRQRLRAVPEARHCLGCAAERRAALSVP